ncbi:hypothetical protein K435DRAFT_794945 [Dendrothele bispora CBS 962.96]|uniref:Uncharacterized protein n=1 Tax=Dendrothele bispora (strain CBS 962.96) TaxID=1314807 RepID=A0A4S8MAG2_DENBC|nr:hypothetical protein K435DRAFT_794945 [Dendrothele bispora CBS 962.96]
MWFYCPQSRYRNGELVCVRAQLLGTVYSVIKVRGIWKINGGSVEGVKTVKETFARRRFGISSFWFWSGNGISGRSVVRVFLVGIRLEGNVADGIIDQKWNQGNDRHQKWKKQRQASEMEEAVTDIRNGRDNDRHQKWKRQRQASEMEEAVTDIRNGRDNDRYQKWKIKVRYHHRKSTRVKETDGMECNVVKLRKWSYVRMKARM